MHNKFLVFGNRRPDDVCPIGSVARGEIHETKVRTGSMNLSWNATRSLENAVIIESNKIASAYMNEFALLLGISEPLDWRSEWIQPEYRIGT